MAFEKIYKTLELEGKGGFVSLASPDWVRQVSMPERMLRLFTDKECPLSQLSALFCFGGKPLIFFFEDPKDEYSLHKAIWNLNEIPVVVVGTGDTVNVYAAVDSVICRHILPSARTVQRQKWNKPSI